MADEKDPEGLEPSKNRDDETTTPHQHDDDSATPDSANDHEVDPETRMLEQIAGLKDDKDDAAPDDKPDDEPSTNDDQPTEVLGEGEPNPGTEPVSATQHEADQDELYGAKTEHTAVLNPVSAEADAGDDTPWRPTAERQKKRRWPWVVAVVILLLGGGYVGLAFATQDSLPATLTVEGVDVSGLSAEEAAPVLEEEFAARAEREITVAVDDEAEATIIPADAGYSYDVDATLEELTDLTFNPVALWSRLFGEAHVSAETSVDEATSSETIAGLTEQLTFEPTEGSLVFEEAELNYTEPVNGFTVDQEALAEELEAQWLSDTRQLDAPGEVEDPAVSSEEWDQFIAETAEPLIEAPYTVTADDATAQLSPAQLAEAAEVRIEAVAEEASATDQESATDDESATEESGEDRPVLNLDGDALADALAENNSEFESTNQDATVRLTGAAGSGEPEGGPGSTGRGE